jgi:hypothetical protein
MRRQTADIGHRVDLDTQQTECGTVGGDHLERNAAKAQKADRIRRIDEAIDERRLDLVEIGLRRGTGLLPRTVRRLPLRHRALERAVVPGAAMVVMMRMGMSLGMCMTVTMPMTVVVMGMIMRMIVIMAVFASPVHRVPQ